MDAESIQENLKIFDFTTANAIQIYFLMWSFIWKNLGV